MHLLLQRPELRAFCAEHAILLQSYGHHKPELTRVPALSAAAAALGLARGVAPSAAAGEGGSGGERAAATAVGLLSMRWALQVGSALIPRSRRIEYVEANKRVFGFTLPAQVMDALRAADANVSTYGLHEIFVQDRVR